MVLWFLFFSAFFSAPCMLFQSLVVKDQDQIWERKELMKMVGSDWWIFLVNQRVFGLVELDDEDKEFDDELIIKQLGKKN
jgi:hypothetical protein